MYRIKSPPLQRLTYLSVNFVYHVDNTSASDRRNKRQGALSILFTSSRERDERDGRRSLLLLLLLLEYALSGFVTR